MATGVDQSAPVAPPRGGHVLTSLVLVNRRHEPLPRLQAAARSQ